MPLQPLATLLIDDPLQINKTQFKPPIEQENQHRHTNNLCLYYEEPSHVDCEYLKKCGQHEACATFVTNPQ
jgi:hypothetical protein